VKRGKGTIELYPKLTVEYRDDPILLAELIRLILSFIEDGDSEDNGTIDNI
jgi:hypothetical protein